MMNRLTTTTLSLLLAGCVGAQERGTVLTLDSCRALALRNNKELRMAESRQQAAHYERRAAFTHFLPRVSATGAYLYTSKELSLLSDEQKSALKAPLNLPEGGTYISSLLGGVEGALRTDTRNMGGVGVMLTQPLYMGGKIAAYNRISRYAEQVAARQHDLALQNLIVEVDEAYWRIVSLEAQRRLAESYLELVQRLDSDVQRMIAEGIATQADGLSVRVKVNEAQVAMIQVDNGLELSRMSLCQVCGLPLDTSLSPDPTPSRHPLLAPPFVGGGQSRLSGESNPVGRGEGIEGVSSLPLPTGERLERSEERLELQMLSLSTSIYKEKVRMARAEFLPTVALTGGYMATNPSVFNSFERQMKGMWTVGVVANVPIVTFGERRYKIRAAQADVRTASLQWEEMREKVDLQVSQCRQKLQEAEERLETARRSQEEADENLRHARLGLAEGVIPLSNVLEAQTAWLSARSTYVTADIDLRLADLYLRKATGSLTLE